MIKGRNEQLETVVHCGATLICGVDSVQSMEFYLVATISIMLHVTI